MNVLRRMLIAMALLVGVMVLFAGNALASTKSGPREGSDGNNVVCGGVPSKAELLRLANGGADACGNRDIAAIWQAQGITLQEIQTMHLGTVCSSQGFTSSGRHHSPNPALDRPIMVDGHVIYFRPLSVWGSACYTAWVTHTEDGRTVAILVGCGNGEVTVVVVHHPTPTPAKPAPKKTGHVSIFKVAKDSTGKVMPTPTGTFQFQVASMGMSTKVVVNHAPQPAGTCKMGAMVYATELAPLGSAGQWVNEGPKTQKQRCTAKTKFVFVDREAAAPPSKTPGEICVEQYNGSWNSGNNTCTITTGNCTNVIIIQGNNNTVNTGSQTCTNTPPPSSSPPPPSPPPTPKPAPNCYFDTTQELDTSNGSITYTEPVRLHCTAPSGDSLTITLHADCGTLSQHTISLTANGSDQTSSVTYTSPTEACNDTVYAHVVDNTAGQTTDVKVGIKVTNPNPNPS